MMPPSAGAAASSATLSGAGAVLEVDLGAIAQNWQTLRARHPSGPVAAVVKADGYGLGARTVAPALYRAGCRHFFVAHLNEALAIRALVPDAFLAVLNGLIPGDELQYRAHGIMPVLGSLREIGAWTAFARRTGQALPGIVHVDTGMARLGLDRRELAELRDTPSLLAGIDLRYVMTHLVASEVAGDPMNEAQRARFALACAALPAAPRSFANSSGIFLGAGWGSDLARPGAALFGINPTPAEKNPMRQVARLRVRVLSVRDVLAGESVGYNATWTASRPSRIATAAIGYADGWLRSQSGRGMALFHPRPNEPGFDVSRFDETPIPLVGRVSMDLTTFDVTDHPAIRPDDWLELIGPARTPDDVALAAGTNGYEILTSLGQRFQRVYLA